MRDSNRLTAGSSSLFAAEGLLSRCYVLGDSTICAGESASVLGEGVLCHCGQGLLSCYSIRLLSNCSGELRVPLGLQKIVWDFFRVTVEPPQTAVEKMLSSSKMQAGSCLGAAWGFTLVSVEVHSLFVVGRLLSRSPLHTPLYLWHRGFSLVVVVGLLFNCGRMLFSKCSGGGSSLIVM